MKMMYHPRGEDKLEEVEFIGLMKDERGDTVAIIRRKGFGLYVQETHPSRLSPIEDNL